MDRAWIRTVAKAFEPLFSTKSYGCGLGLATRKKIIEKMAVPFVQSRVGVGTKVTMSLPNNAGTKGQLDETAQYLGGGR